MTRLQNPGSLYSLVVRRNRGRQQVQRGQQLGAAALAIAFSLTMASCSGKEEQKPKESPSRVENSRAESDLATVFLTEQAVNRLGIATGEIARRQIPRSRRVTAVVAVPPGRDVSVAAPVAGTIAGDAAGTRPGASVTRGQAVLRLRPLAPDTDLERAEAEAVARLEAARQQAERAKKLLDARAGSAKDEERARSELTIAEANVLSLRNQRSQLGVGSGSALTLTSPFDGRLADLLVAPGQTVVAGAPLFRVVALDRLWLRVPVYAGDLHTIDAQRPLDISQQMGQTAGAATDAEPVLAQPVVAPPTADATASTVDLYYQLPQGLSGMTPGQRLVVDLPLRESSEERLSVPSSAIVFDVHGGTWVYEVRAPGEYVRRRVEVAFTRGEFAALIHGPPVGTTVVTVGVAEIFGTEFGVGK